MSTDNSSDERDPVERLAEEFVAPTAAATASHQPSTPSATRSGPIGSMHCSPRSC